MNKHTSEVLEYSQLLELIAGYVQSPAGRQVVLSSRPGTVLSEIQSRHGLYRDMLALRESQSMPGLNVENLSEICRELPGRCGVA